MKSVGLLKQALAIFLLSLAVYAAGYRAIESWRTRNGPWQVGFTNDAAGAPALRINQPKLALTNVLIVFPGERLPPSTRAPAELALTQPRQVPFDVPFGRCLFVDTTSLPGTLVLVLFGHEIQLLPRALTIDKVEQPWKSNQRLTLQPSPVPPAP